MERFESQAKERWDRITQSILNILPPPMTDAQLNGDRFVHDLLLRGKYLDYK